MFLAIKDRRASMKVLVAEDSMVMRQLLVAQLNQWNYEVIEAGDGAEAWRLFQEHSISLVLTDWMMPQVDGLELIRRIRSSGRSGYCYLILLTAKEEKEDLVTAMEAGADDFLVKPCDQEELRVRLRQGERIIRLERELAEQNRQLRQTQAALIESEKLAGLGRLAAGMAHEINNPIAFVTNNLAVLQREIGSLVALVEKQEQTREFLRDVPEQLRDELAQLADDCDFAWLREYLPKLLLSSTQGLRRVRDIVKHLRDFANLDQAAQGELDLGLALMSTLEMLKLLIDQQQLQVTTTFEPVPKLLCRPDKIHQVLYNIILNAVQASNIGGVIALGLKSESGRVQVSVEDCGIGMDRSTLERVFEPFFTTKPVGTGTGLGMAVSYGIVRDHGGTITIDSQLQRGTTVRVDLPLQFSRDCPTA
jgi:two-component system, NtrC family, sensor kinase